MCFIIKTADYKWHSWYVTEPKPKFDLPAQNNHIVTLQAYGQELEAIKNRFSNLPICPTITTWRGDMAQLIYDNL